MIALPRVSLSPKEKEYVLDCLSRNDIGTGRYVKKFEEEFAKYIGRSYATAVNTGTAALHLALVALEIKEGDEVIVPSFTFIATAEAIKYCGATPVFVDCNLDDWCIDVNLIEKAITPKTKAIIPVHIFGNSCEMDKIQEIAKKHNLTIVEDAAEAAGSEYNGKKCGSFSEIACFSFFGNKLITSAEGGMCLTDNPAIHEKIFLLKSHGKEKTGVLNSLPDYPKKQYLHKYLGYNYRMTNLHAAVGLGQLENIEKTLTKKREIADLYKEVFQKHGLDKHFQWQKENGKGNCWMIGILCQDGKIQDGLTRHLNSQNIETRSFFYPMHKHPFFPSTIITKDGCPKSVAEEINERGITLPNDLSMTPQELESVALAIENFLAQNTLAQK